MSAQVWNWLVVFEDGTTTTLRGETPADALYDFDCWERYIVAIVRNGW